jgi:hypothetical protein
VNGSAARDLRDTNTRMHHHLAPHFSAVSFLNSKNAASAQFRNIFI